MSRQYSEKELMMPVPPDEQLLLANLAAAISQLPENGDVTREVYMDFRGASLALEEFYVRRKMDEMSEDDYFNRGR